MGDPVTEKDAEEANRSAGNWAIVAGAILFIAGMTGVALWAFITNALLAAVPLLVSFGILLTVLVFLASLGGLMVIAGGVTLRGNRPGTGKFFIALGAGFGLIGLIFLILTWVFTLSSPATSAPVILGLLGLVLSIVARMKAKKPSKQ